MVGQQNFSEVNPKSSPIDIEGLPPDIRDLWNDYVNEFMKSADIVATMREEAGVKPDQLIPHDVFLRHIDEVIKAKEGETPKLQAFLKKFKEYRSSIN